MHRPYKHILIENLSPVLIDFERCRRTQNPKNVTQFCDFLTGEDVILKLKNKKIKIDIDIIRNLAKKYKDRLEKKDYNKIKKYILEL